MIWWYCVRTWALICGGISRMLVSIFARTLERFILSLAGSEDMTSVKMQWSEFKGRLLSGIRSSLALAPVLYSPSRTTHSSTYSQQVLESRQIFVCPALIDHHHQASTKLPHNLSAGRLPTYPCCLPKCLRESTSPVPDHRTASLHLHHTEMTPTALAPVHRATSRARQTQTTQSRKLEHTRPK